MNSYPTAPTRDGGSVRLDQVTRIFRPQGDTDVWNLPVALLGADPSKPTAHIGPFLSPHDARAWAADHYPQVSLDPAVGF